MASIIGTILTGSSLFGGVKSLLTNGGRTQIADIVIDAVLNEVVTYKANVTEHPIENKTAISDHIFKNPLQVKIEGYITDSPIRIMGLFETPLQKNTLDNVVGNIKQAMPFLEHNKASDKAYFALKELFENRQLISLVTKHESFSNMAIESLNFNDNEHTGGRLEFSAELVQINYSKVESTALIVGNNNLARLASPTTSYGIVGNKSVPKSFLASGFDKIAGLF